MGGLTAVPVTATRIGLGYSAQLDVLLGAELLDDGFEGVGCPGFAGLQFWQDGFQCLVALGLSLRQDLLDGLAGRTRSAQRG